MNKIRKTRRNVNEIRYFVKRNPVISGLLLIFGVLIVYHMSGSLFKTRDNSHAGGEFEMTVEARKVDVQSIEDKVVTVGSVNANESVIIRPELAGRIKHIRFHEGSEVKQGDILVELDDEVHQADLDQAKARLKLSNATHQRVEKLQKYKSPADTDKAYSDQMRDQALVKRHTAICDKTKIMAPFDGIVGLRVVSPGDYINVGDDIVNLENIDLVKIDFKLPELYVAKVKNGQDIQIKSDALAGKEFSGKVYAINPHVDANGRSVSVRAKVQNTHRNLLPGMFVVVSVFLDRFDHAILIPEEALVPKEKEQYVFCVINKKAKLTKVKVGLRENGKAHIIQGLSPQDIVVTAGQLKIQDGMPVKIINIKG